MDSTDLFLTIFIFFVFLFLYIFNIFYVKYKEIKRNWPRYKCQSMIMPFANFFGHNVNDNFISCIGNMQGNLMSQFLAPLMKNLKSISSVGDGLSGDLLKASSMGGNLESDQLTSFGNMGNAMDGFKASTKIIEDSMKKTESTMESAKTQFTVAMDKGGNMPDAIEKSLISDLLWWM